MPLPAVPLPTMPAASAAVMISPISLVELVMIEFSPQSQTAGRAPSHYDYFRRNSARSNQWPARPPERFLRIVHRRYFLSSAGITVKIGGIATVAAIGKVFAASPFLSYRPAFDSRCWRNAA